MREVRLIIRASKLELKHDRFMQRSKANSLAGNDKGAKIETNIALRAKRKANKIRERL